MKILVVCQYYYPEPFRISDICEELVEMGHEVTVVTGIPNYPMGEIYEGYRHGKKRDETINGVTVHRCFTIGRKNRALRRFANYCSYSLSSSFYVAGMKEEYDVVFVNQLSPVMMSRAAIKYKKKHNKKLVMYCLDLWPESLVAGNIRRGSLIYTHYYRVSKKIYRQADTILITSKMFRNFLTSEFGIKSGIIKYLPQYAEASFGEIKQIERAGKKTFDLVFAGNIGAAQSVNTIVEAAELLKEREDIVFHIVGDGSQYEHCRALAEKLGLTSVIFYGRQPLEKMPEYYSIADAMLVTLSSDPVISLTLPGKVQSCMAAGKPIIGSAEGEIATVISDTKCGLCGEAENARALADNILILASDADLLAACAENSLSYYKENFDRAKYFKTLVAELEKQAGQTV